MRRESVPMPAKKYQGELTAEEYQRWDRRGRRGPQGARKLSRARSLRKAAGGRSAEERAQAGDPGGPTLARTRTRVASSRLAALEQRPRPGRKRRREERGEARLSAEAGSPAPGGGEQGTGQGLAARGGEVPRAERCADEPVQRVRKTPRSSRG